MKKMKRRRSESIICGDWNIAHKEIDLKNWRQNRKNSGFLPEDPLWFCQITIKQFSGLNRTISFAAPHHKISLYG